MNEVDYFQNLVLLYLVEVIENMRRKSRGHDSELPRMLEAKGKWKTQYYKEHMLLEEADELSRHFEKLKADLRSGIIRLAIENTGRTLN